MMFKGIRNDEVGALLVGWPIRQQTAVRGEKQTLPGRDGFLIVPKGWQEITVKQDICVRNYANLERVRKWLSGAGELVFGDYPDLAYDAAIITPLPHTNVYKRLPGQKFTVTFTCQPFLHMVDEQAISITASGNFPSDGDVDALPLVKVEGAGTQTLTINGRRMTLILTSGVPLYIDCDAGTAYTEAGGVKTFAGDRVSVLDDWYTLNAAPSEGYAVNSVALTAGITRVTIQPRWRWV